MQKQVVCFGEILWDCFPGDKKPGGAPMNVALHLSKWGINSTLISAVGDDKDGKLLRNYIWQNRLDIRYLQTNSALETGTVNVHLDEHGQAAYTIVEPVAWDAIGYHEEYHDLLKNADAFVFGSLAAREATSRETLLKLLDHSKLKIFDMNLRPPHFTKELLETLLHKANVLKINEHELSYLEQRYELTYLQDIDKFKWLGKTFNLQTICVTLGDKGAMVWFDGGLYSHPGFKVQVADTVGAGDAFLAAFIAGTLEKKSIKKMLARACAAGALIASRPGANSEYDLEEIRNLINKV